MTEASFFWHDYETFGLRPQRDRPAQFAGIRTDLALNIIGEPLELFCQPTNDFLPDPVSVLITGITPQMAQSRGLPEFEFVAAIHAALAAPGTCGTGYNTLRFDDELTRHLLWRNLYDPYGREWQQQCSRWDLLDCVRATYAFRPDGIDWPLRDDGSPSFKLEHLTAANGLSHQAAHDALSDVHATISLARLIRQQQPKLFEFCYRLRKKDAVVDEIAPTQRRPFLHISGMYPAQRGCLAVVMPLAWHPTNKNELAVWDLAHDPSELFALDAEQVRQRLFSRSDELPEGVGRLPIKTIHLNKSPVVVNNLRTLSPARAEALGIDMAQAMRHADLLSSGPDLVGLLREVYQARQFSGARDVDEALYDGFIGDADRRRLERLRRLGPSELVHVPTAFDDGRLEELLFRYRARNWPDSLNADEQQRWANHRRERLIDGVHGGLNLQGHAQLLAEQRLAHADDTRATALLDATDAWAKLQAEGLP
ncbi:exodeoxyribonuclease I [Chitinimonas sp.]|uniref:exodeoxyribonuclease I n=1 Tax=Chitinimonas sp. TaxID=1934313 RepID=UPI0035B3C8F9